VLKNGKLQLALFCLGHVVILLPLFNTLYAIHHSSTALYLEYASRIWNGHLPYQDFPLEYPPFSLVFFLVPRLFASGLSAYAGAFQIEVLIYDLLGLYILYRIAQNKDIPPWKMLAVYSAAVLAIGPIFFESYDIFSAILTLLSVFFFCGNKHRWAWVFLALGFMTKFYPAVIAPIYIFYYLRDRSYKRIWEGLTIFAGVCLVILLPFLVTAPGSIGNLVNTHSARPLQLETTYSSVLLIIDKVTNNSPEIVYSYGSKNIMNPPADTLAAVSWLVMVLLLLAAYWLICRSIKSNTTSSPETGMYALLVIGVLLVSGKILSPQFLIWLLPLLPLVGDKKGILLTAFFIVIGGLTYYIYPAHYQGLENNESMVIAALFIRNLLLIFLTATIAVFIYKSKSRTNHAIVP
jgi:uncharacterized membrane protein